MGRKSRTTNSNIVIVCEGTETEVKYFNCLKDFVNNNFPEKFSDIRIVPTKEDMSKMKAGGNRPKRYLGVSHDGFVKYYYIQGEKDLDTYNLYKEQPTRYVREAKLFMDNDGYTEAWAVYDNDNFPDHKKAAELANSGKNLHIAYSSISFEEWILFHFERNSKPFERSVCKTNNKDRMCGTGDNPDDCNGQCCVAGYLRKKNYLKNYMKNMGELFSILKPRLPIAVLNASWSRIINKNPNFWECNPYTTVDKLVTHMLGCEDYEWVDSSVNINGTNLEIKNNNIKNLGPKTFVDQMIFFDDLLNEKTSRQVSIVVNGTEKISSQNGAAYFGFKDRNTFKVKVI